MGVIRMPFHSPSFQRGKGGDGLVRMRESSRTALVEQQFSSAGLEGSPRQRLAPDERAPPAWLSAHEQHAEGGFGPTEQVTSTLAVYQAVQARDETYPNLEKAKPVEVPTSRSSATRMDPSALQPVKLRWYTKLAYAMPEMSKLSVTMLLNVHAIAFFNAFGADISTLSFLIALARSLDVLTDPLMGWLSDSTRSRYGRRRLYMLMFSPLYALCLIALMSGSQVFASVSDEAARAGGLVSWFGVFYTLFYLTDTGSNVPHSALGPELTDEQGARNSLFFLAGLFKMFGILIAAMMPVAIEYKLSAERGCHTPAQLASLSWPPCELVAQGLGLQYTAVFLGLWYVLAILFACRMLKERPASVSTLTPPLVPSLMATRRNSPFMTLLPTWVLDQLAITLVTTMITFFYTCAARATPAATRAPSARAPRAIAPRAC